MCHAAGIQSGQQRSAACDRAHQGIVWTEGTHVLGIPRHHARQTYDETEQNYASPGVLSAILSCCAHTVLTWKLGVCMYTYTRHILSEHV